MERRYAGDPQLLRVGRGKGALHKGTVHMEDIRISVLQQRLDLTVELRRRKRVLDERDSQRAGAEHLVAKAAVIIGLIVTRTYHTAVAPAVHQLGIVMYCLHNAVNDRIVRIDKMR